MNLITKALDCYDGMCQAATELGWPKRYEADLHEHDKAFVASIYGNKPFLWMIRESGTHTVPLYGKSDSENSAEYMVNFMAGLHPAGKWFHWNPDENTLHPVTVDEAKAIGRAANIEYVPPVPNKFVVECPEHLEAVQEFARSVGAEAALEEQLDRLRNYGGGNWEVHLGKDWAPHSFRVAWHKHCLDGVLRFSHNGGLIYEGPGQPADGSFPSLTVSLVPSTRVHDWGLHT